MNHFKIPFNSIFDASFNSRHRLFNFLLSHVLLGCAITCNNYCGFCHPKITHPLPLPPASETGLYNHCKNQSSIFAAYTCMTLTHFLNLSEPQFPSPIKYCLHRIVGQLKEMFIECLLHFLNVPQMVTIIEDRHQT